MFFFFKRFFYIILYRIFNFAAPQEGESIILDRMFPKKNKGFYIDIGAHHPIRFSITKSLYDRGWKGINIEPNPDSINFFRKYRKRDINLNLALSKSISATYYQFHDPALNTINKRIYTLRNKQGAKFIKKTSIQCKDFSYVHQKYIPKNQEIDLLKIDVEGSELDILRTVNWKVILPKVIICEILDLDIESLTKNKLYKFLRKKNYSLYSKLLQNCIFIHRSFKGSF